MCFLFYDKLEVVVDVEPEVTDPCEEVEENDR